MPIGGAEDKVGRMSILRDVARLAGGAQARLVVLSTASSLGDEITNAYLALFASLGVRDVRGIRPESRAQAADPALAATVGDATAVFMTGGNQTKLAALVVGTPLGEAIVAAHRRGALIAGTSAGASICSEHMVSFGSEGATPKFRVGQVSQGLGLLTGAIVDQHFTQRNRFGRLLALVGANPAQLGIGIDEDTAAIVAPGGTVRGARAWRGHRHRRGRPDHHRLHGDRHPAVDDVRTCGCTPCLGARSSTCARRILVSAPGLADTSEPQSVTTLADVPAGTRPRSRRIAAEGAPCQHPRASPPSGVRITPAGRPSRASAGNGDDDPMTAQPAAASGAPSGADAGWPDSDEAIGVGRMWSGRDMTDHEVHPREVWEAIESGKDTAAWLFLPRKDTETLRAAAHRLEIDDLAIEDLLGTDEPVKLDWVGRSMVAILRAVRFDPDANALHVQPVSLLAGRRRRAGAGR